MCVRPVSDDELNPLRCRASPPGLAPDLAPEARALAIGQLRAIHTPIRKGTSVGCTLPATC